eukprot:2266677-Rhodomonas_salina.2
MIGFQTFLVRDSNDDPDLTRYVSTGHRVGRAKAGTEHPLCQYRTSRAVPSRGSVGHRRGPVPSYAVSVPDMARRTIGRIQYTPTRCQYWQVCRTIGRIQYTPTRSQYWTWRRRRVG